MKIVAFDFLSQQFYWVLMFIEKWLWKQNYFDQWFFLIIYFFNMNVFEFLLKMKCLYQLTLYNPLFAHVYGLNEFFFFHSSECAWLIFNMNITIPNNSYNHYLASCIEPILMPTHTKADWLPFLNVCNWQQ